MMLSLAAMQLADEGKITKEDAKNYIKERIFRAGHKTKGEDPPEANETSLR